MKSYVKNIANYLREILRKNLIFQIANNDKIAKRDAQCKYHHTFKALSWRFYIKDLKYKTIYSFMINPAL
jgi:hypothetical protein